MITVRLAPRCTVLLFIGLIALASGIVQNPNCDNYFVKYNDLKVDYRLPLNVKPLSYDLQLQPDLDTGLFLGVIKITTTVQKATKTITLHSDMLDIISIDVTRNGQEVTVVEYRFETLRQFLVIELDRELSVNDEVIIDIEYEGDMNNKLTGLYTTSYLKQDKTLKPIATSKFEPTYARQAFPCFDEPNLKANFTVSLIRPTDGGYMALSNMNQISETNYGVTTMVAFAESVPMSTYLACFLISDFAYNSSTIDTQGIGENFPIRIFAVQDQLEKVNFALETAVAVTQFYIQYYKVEYPLPKLDMAAIPDFASNAMEHWGLLTYRETALLYDPSYSSTYNKQRVAMVVAHELAHMWFGNLVTLNWWNDLWLNEGFARYMQYISLNQVYTDWDLPNQFTIITQQTIMVTDASVAAHPIVHTVETPNEISDNFDTISYDKGASVIRMMADIVGAEKFEKAVTSYLTKYKYSNTVTDDFLTEVANQALDFDVKLMMSTWTEQMGYPVVEVKKTSDTQFTLTQKRFFSNIDDYKQVFNDSIFNYTWTIPLTYRTNLDNTVQRKWFPYDQEAVVITVPAGTKWIKLNNLQVGYYRVNYEADNWKSIINELIENPMTFSTGDRAHILNDVFALADASQLSYETALSTLQYLEKEEDFAPWYVAAVKIEELSNSLRYTEIYVDFLQYARKLLTNVYYKVTWNVDENNHLQNRLRVSILKAACALGLPDCLNESGQRFQAWLNDENEIPKPDLREIVYYYGMQKLGTSQVWDKVWQRFINEQDANEKLKLMYGLSAVRTPWLLNRFISLAANENYVRRQDYFTCLGYIADNPAGEPIVWDYVRENLPELLKRFGITDRYLGKMWATIVKYFNTNTKLEEMSEFFNKYPKEAAGESSRKRGIETVKYNIRWLENNLENISVFLTQTNSK